MWRPFRSQISKLFPYILLTLICGFSFSRSFQKESGSPLYLLLINSGQQQSVSTQVWLAALREEGFPFELRTDDELLNPDSLSNKDVKGILLPDGASAHASPALCAYLNDFVERGGKLALVGDALSKDFDRHYLETFPADSIFHFPKMKNLSRSGPQYQNSVIEFSDSWIKRLQIPPGLYTHAAWDQDPSSLHELTNYQAKRAEHPVWPTEAETDSGEAAADLQTSTHDFVAGTRFHGLGAVYWVNLPLAYLKTRTDGLLLHSFIREIGLHFFRAPQLLPVPNGVGGLILNLHVDSNAAFPSLQRMKKLKVFDSGPFSIDVTAGPDARSFGDGLGFDVPKGGLATQWISEWKKKGHAVGSHGGWIHDYFGLNLSEKKSSEMENLLELNREWMTKALGRPVQEYSSPLGNQPVWLADWLEKKGYSSYYFTGNSGMGPTQNFRDNVQTDHKLWAFPASSYQQAASFEEASDQKIPGSRVLAWLSALSRFNVENSSVRLFYFHPPGLRFYETEFLEWMKRNQVLKQAGIFNWYTMEGMADFLNDRKSVIWNLRALPGSKSVQLSVLANARAKSLVFKLPREGIQNLRVSEGKAEIDLQNEAILIHAQLNQNLKLTYEEEAN